VKQKRIDEIRAMNWHPDRFPAHEIAVELLDALEEAQSENERLRVALRQIHPLLMVISLGRYCYCNVCNGRIDEHFGGHDDDCPFRVLEENSD
jgi:RNA polymerase-binding transcription factor DksA